MPKLSTPALLPTMVRPVTPLSCKAAMRFSGIPQSESAGRDGHVVLQQAVKSGFGVRVNFAHVRKDLATDSGG